MAEASLSSLEYWLNNIKLSKLKPYYPLVLNKFDDYLQMSKASSRSSGSSDDNVQDKVLTLKVTYKGKGRKKLPVNLFNKNASLENSDIYEQIQFRILKILGHLAGEMSHCLFGETNQANNIVAWDTVQHLKFNMPFVDMKPTIYFDRFLQRIVYLSLSSTSRQTKVNACELLHAIVVYMIGKSVADPSGNVLSAQFQLNRIYRRVYPALFRLACDVDHFPRNLFQPLCMQIIHWFHFDLIKNLFHIIIP
jgi:DNA-dependent protein kinase catalytic subunit